MKTLPRHRVSLAASAVLLFMIATTSPADAVETRFWSVDSRGSFEECESDGVSIDGDGAVTLATEQVARGESSEVYFWDIAFDGD